MDSQLQQNVVDEILISAPITEGEAGDVSKVQRRKRKAKPMKHNLKNINEQKDENEQPPPLVIEKKRRKSIIAVDVVPLRPRPNTMYHDEPPNVPEDIQQPPPQKKQKIVQRRPTINKQVPIIEEHKIPVNEEDPRDPIPAAKQRKSRRKTICDDSNSSEVEVDPLIIITTNIYQHGVKKELFDATLIADKCDCKTRNYNCGRQCRNRSMSIECSLNFCGEDCTNTVITTKSLVKSVAKFKTTQKGYGIRATEDIFKDKLIVEYTGEVMFMESYKKRIQTGVSHHYSVEISNNIVIDGYRKGSLCRFVNHSCKPNCQMAKVHVEGVPRIVLQAIVDIPASTELTYDYKFMDFEGSEPQPCYCGENICRGTLSVLQRRGSLSVKDGEKTNKYQPKKKVDQQQQQPEAIPTTKFSQRLLNKKLKEQKDKEVQPPPLVIEKKRRKTITAVDVVRQRSRRDTVYYDKPSTVADEEIHKEPPQKKQKIVQRRPTLFREEQVSIIEENSMPATKRNSLMAGKSDDCEPSCSKSGAGDVTEVQRLERSRVKAKEIILKDCAMEIFSLVKQKLSSYEPNNQEQIAMYYKQLNNHNNDPKSGFVFVAKERDVQSIAGSPLQIPDMMPEEPILIIDDLTEQSHFLRDICIQLKETKDDDGNNCCNLIAIPKKSSSDEGTNHDRISNPMCFEAIVRDVRTGVYDDRPHVFSYDLKILLLNCVKFYGVHSPQFRAMKLLKDKFTNIKNAVRDELKGIWNDDLMTDEFLD